jgi:hypothetical protein
MALFNALRLPVVPADAIVACIPASVVAGGVEVVEQAARSNTKSNKVGRFTMRVLLRRNVAANCGPIFPTVPEENARVFCRAAIPEVSPCDWSDHYWQPVPFFSF